MRAGLVRWLLAAVCLFIIQALAANNSDVAYSAKKKPAPKPAAKTEPARPAAAEDEQGQSAEDSTDEGSTSDKGSKDKSGAVRPYKAGVLVEAETGDVLFEFNAHTPLPPASMTKMMTMYLIMERIEQGALKLTDMIIVSARASKIGGSQVYLKEHEQFSVEEMMHAIVIHSANDACMAMAEHISGSPEAFIDMMNAKAALLGMTATTFHSVSGLPPSEGQQEDMTTAYDMALLGRHLARRFPKVLEWASIPETTFRNGEFVLTNTNKLLGRFPGVDGIKTGYYSRAGHCITATAQRDGMRFVAVIMGGESGAKRFDEAARLLSQGFNSYAKQQLAVKGQIIDIQIPVSGAAVSSIRPIVSSDTFAIIQPDRANEIKFEPICAKSLRAPLPAGFLCGEAVFKLGDREIARADLIIAEEIPRKSLLSKLFGFMVAR